MSGALLAPLTTLGVGGPARRIIRVVTEADLIAAVRAVDEAGERLLIIGGGSNLVISDHGFDGTVVQIASTGFTIDAGASSVGSVLVHVQAGQSWDALVDEMVRQNLSGLEALSGIPGLTGATPVQNVGAYGSDVSQTISTVRVWDREVSAVRSFSNVDLGFSYRGSLLKQTTVQGSPRYVVLNVDFLLTPGSLSAPVRYAELARAVGVDIGEPAAATDVRREVLRLRRAKGMVLDANDRDTFSTGSFFTNPIVPASVAAQLPADAPKFPVHPGSTDSLSGTDVPVKLSAAWLIDRAGFAKGFGLGSAADPREDGPVVGSAEGSSETGSSAAGSDPASVAAASIDTRHTESYALANGRAAVSTKHTLAITNRGGATADDVLAIARAVAGGVESRFGIRLHPEPLLIGCAL